MLGQETNSCLRQHSYQQDRLHYDAQSRNNHRWQQQEQVVSYTHTTQQLKVEIDCIDSFLDFANYLDNVNPICSPESIDTVDKLLNTLAQR